ncbi:hypothetical protein ACWGQ5_49820 [Streptomyces sp. NPDC055722]
MAARERRAAADWAVSLRAAQLTYANADMTGLVVSAGLALPSYRLHPEDVTHPHGLLVWEDPVVSPEAAGDAMSSIAVSWAVRGSGVHLRIWTTREEWFEWMARPDPRAGMGAMSRDAIRVMRTRYPTRVHQLLVSAVREGARLAALGLERHQRDEHR